LGAALAARSSERVEGERAYRVVASEKLPTQTLAAPQLSWNAYWLALVVA
jgi:hypothetical protein